MMMKEKSHPWARLKYLYVLPLAVISMVAFAHTEAANNSNGISEAKGTEVLANEQTSIVKSSENEKVLIVVDGKLTIQNVTPTDWTNEDLAKHIGVTPEEIAQIEVIKEPEILTQWNVPGATGAILVTTKKAKATDEEAKAANEKFTVYVNKAGEYSYGRMGGTLKKGSLDDVANYIQTERRKLTAAGGGQYLAVNVKVDKDTPMGNVDKLKETLRKIWTLRITYSKMEEESTSQSTVEEMSELPGSTEELVKKLPGAQMDEDGKITIDGKEVKKIMANGKEFFVSDQVINTNNSEQAKGTEEGTAKGSDAEEVFQVVENMPEFPGGNTELMKYLAKNINYPAEAQQKGEQGRVIVQFVVGKDGKLSDIKIMRSISPTLDAEAIRVIKAMPDWKPGTQRGQAVAVKYTIPISFSLEPSGIKDEEQGDIRMIAKGDVKAVYDEPRKQDTPKTDSDEVFQVVENMPEFPGGMAELMKFLQQNIKYPEQAQKDSIQGRVIVQFVINKMGQVTDPTIMRSVSPELDAEALRITNAMPLWTPGKQKGKAVNVKFTLPITFKLNAPETTQK